MLHHQHGDTGVPYATDQINALRALGTDPIRKLVVPRMLAGIFMAPVLTVIADFVERYSPGGLKFSINDGGARPDTVSLRLAQAVRLIGEDGQ